jgi:hypothetical protein
MSVDDGRSETTRMTKVGHTNKNLDPRGTRFRSVSGPLRSVITAAPAAGAANDFAPVPQLAINVTSAAQSEKFLASVLVLGTV